MTKLIRQQIRTMSQGSNFMNDAYSVVNEYIIRQKLYAIGFTAGDLCNLDAEQANHFIVIANEIEIAKQEAEKRAMKKGR